MLQLYCLPGRAIAELFYLFPASGTVWASARRRESRIAHFIFATFFYVGAVMLISSMINPKARSKSENVTLASANSPRAQNTRRPRSQTIINEGSRTAPVELDQVINQIGGFAVQLEKGEELVTNSSDWEPQSANEAEASANEVVNPSFTSVEEKFINDPRHSEAVKVATQAAYATSSRQNWKDGRLTGWAVPSTTNTGCTLVSYTIDQVSSDRQPASSVAICN